MIRGTQGTIFFPRFGHLRVDQRDRLAYIARDQGSHGQPHLKKIQQNRQRSAFDTDHTGVGASPGTPNTQSLGLQGILSSLHTQDKPFCGAQLGFQALGERVCVAAGSQVTVGHDAQCHLVLRLPWHFVACKLHKSLPC